MCVWWRMREAEWVREREPDLCIHIYETQYVWMSCLVANWVCVCSWCFVIKNVMSSTSIPVITNSPTCRRKGWWNLAVHKTFLELHGTTESQNSPKQLKQLGICLNLLTKKQHKMASYSSSSVIQVFESTETPNRYESKIYTLDAQLSLCNHFRRYAFRFECYARQAVRWHFIYFVNFVCRFFHL